MGPRPFLGGHSSAAARLGFDLKRIHDSCCTRQAQTKGSTGRIAILDSGLYIDEPRTVVDRLDLDGAVATHIVFDPAHEQVAPAAAIFENVASKFGCHR